MNISHLSSIAIAALLTASVAQAAPLMEPQDYFGTPAMSAHASTNTVFVEPKLGRVEGSKTSQPEAQVVEPAQVGPAGPVLGRTSSVHTF